MNPTVIMPSPPTPLFLQDIQKPGKQGWASLIWTMPPHLKAAISTLTAERNHAKFLHRFSDGLQYVEVLELSQIGANTIVEQEGKKHLAFSGFPSATDRTLDCNFTQHSNSHQRGRPGFNT